MTTFHATSGFAFSHQDLLLASDMRFQSSLFHNAWVENETKEDGLGDENMNINTSAEDDEDEAHLMENWLVWTKKMTMMSFEDPLVYQFLLQQNAV
jgi:hypothetical protein